MVHWDAIPTGLTKVSPAKRDRGTPGVLFLFRRQHPVGSLFLVVSESFRLVRQLIQVIDEQLGWIRGLTNVSKWNRQHSRCSSHWHGRATFILSVHRPVDDQLAPWTYLKFDKKQTRRSLNLCVWMGFILIYTAVIGRVPAASRESDLRTFQGVSRTELNVLRNIWKISKCRLAQNILLKWGNLSFATVWMIPIRWTDGFLPGFGWN